jgi:hypothetical protein
MTRSVEVRLTKVLALVRKCLPFRGSKAMEKNLEMACGEDLCEAYRIGAEEAQAEIYQRLAALAGPVNVLTVKAPQSDETVPK